MPRIEGFAQSQLRVSVGFVRTQRKTPKYVNRPILSLLFSFSLLGLGFHLQQNVAGNPVFSLQSTQFLPSTAFCCEHGLIEFVSFLVLFSFPAPLTFVVLFSAVSICLKFRDGCFMVKNKIFVIFICVLELFWICKC